MTQGSLSTSIKLDIWFARRVTYTDQKQDSLITSADAQGRKLITGYQTDTCTPGYQSPEIYIIVEFCDGTQTNCPHRQDIDISQLVQDSIESNDVAVLNTLNVGLGIYLEVYKQGTSTIKLTNAPTHSIVLSTTGTLATEVTDLDVRFFTSMVTTSPASTTSTIHSASVELITDFTIPYTQASVLVDALFADGSRMNLRTEHGIMLNSLNEAVVQVIDNETVSFFIIFRLYMLLLLLLLLFTTYLLV